MRPGDRSGQVWEFEGPNGGVVLVLDPGKSAGVDSHNPSTRLYVHRCFNLLVGEPVEVREWTDESFETRISMKRLA